jgi:hypothetical protein
MNDKTIHYILGSVCTLEHTCIVVEHTCLAVEYSGRYALHLNMMSWQLPGTSGCVPVAQDSHFETNRGGLTPHNTIPHTPRARYYHTSVAYNTDMPTHIYNYHKHSYEVSKLTLRAFLTSFTRNSKWWQIFTSKSRFDF